MYLKQLQLDMFRLVNAERNRHGLHNLSWNAHLGTVGYFHCHQMMSLGKLFHKHPINGKNVGERLHEAGINWLGAAENLAWGNAEKSIPGLENIDKRLLYLNHNLFLSKSHRDNLLHPELKEIGIAIIPDTINSQGAKNAIYITQVFRTV